MLRPSFPGRTTPAGTSQNEPIHGCNCGPVPGVLLNQWASVCGAPALGSVIISGLGPDRLGPRNPSCPQSKPWLEDTVRGRPVWKVVIPETCQCPNALPFHPFASRKSGIA